MSQRIPMSVSHETHGDTDLVILPPDIVAWELKNKAKFGHADSPVGTGDLLWMAWKALTRMGQISETFDAWLTGVTDWGDATAEPANPTDAAL